MAAYDPELPLGTSISAAESGLREVPTGSRSQLLVKLLEDVRWRELVGFAG